MKCGKDLSAPRRALFFKRMMWKPELHPMAYMYMQRCGIVVRRDKWTLRLCGAFCLACMLVAAAGWSVSQSSTPAASSTAVKQVGDTDHSKDSLTLAAKAKAKAEKKQAKVKTVKRCVDYEISEPSAECDNSAPCDLSFKGATCSRWVMEVKE